MKTHTTKSQAGRILAWLKMGRKLTKLQALDKFGCMNSGARIEEIRKAGHAIKTTMIKQNGKRFAQYSLS